jgi:putative MATE family efflux protein
VDIKTGNIKKIFFHYLFAGIGSSIISSIYTTVDTMASGQYEGPVATAALSVITPIFTLFMSLSLLIGIGGAIPMSILRGEGDEEKSNEFFTLSLVYSVIACAITTAFISIFREDLLRLCGANDEVLPYALAYVKWVIVAIPSFFLGVILSVFIRNDGAPFLAMLSVICGGVFNIFGDIFFVFTLDMGIEGAGLATMLGQMVAIAILCTHFLRQKCKLKIAKPRKVLKNTLHILKMGFSPFIVDLSYGLVVFIFNNQIMRYSNATYLSIYGALAAATILIQSLFYGVGQAIQPLASVNFGVRSFDRVSSILKYALLTSLAMGLFFFSITFFFPEAIFRMYMDATDEIITHGAGIARIFSFAFLTLGINVVSSYFLQAIELSSSALIISLLRGFVICLILLFLLPSAFGFSAIWLTLPLTELMTLVFALFVLRRKRAHFQKRELAE